MIGQTLSHYKVLSEISRGGTGVVYRALDLKLNREVALKCLSADAVASPDRRARFILEARATATLEHPHIAVTHEVDEAEDTLFITMELLEGETLRDQLLRGRPGTLRALELAIELAEGLAHAHGKGIVHRDFKPSNVIVTTEGHVKIIDFGLAKLVEPVSPESDDVETPFRGERTAGLLIGSAPYMSPEQARGEAVDHRSDVFSFGVVLHEMLTGKRPFEASSLPETLHAVLHVAAPALGSDVSIRALDEIQRVVDKCLAKSAEERYQTMKDVVVDLRAAVRSETGSTSPVRAIQKGGAGRFVRWAVAAGLATALFVSLWYGRLLAPVNPVVVRPVPVTSMQGSEINPSLSPDGTFIAFVWDEGGGAPQQIYVQLVGSSEPVRLTEGQPSGHPTWSPDGREIAYLQRAGANLYDVRVVPASGGRSRSLGTVTAFFPGLEWSPGGGTLAVVHRSSKTTPEGIYLLSERDGSKEQFTQARSTADGDRSPAFSPDGETLAFVRWREGSFTEILVQRLDEAAPSRVASHDGQVRDLAWSHDGSTLIFSSYWRGSIGLWNVSLAGDEPRPLPFGENATEVSAARYANRIVFAQRSVDVNIWRASGPSASTISPPFKWIASTRDDWSPEYSPDGRLVAFASDRSGDTQIWLWDTVDGDLSRIDFKGNATVPRWSPDGRLLAFAGDVDGQFDVFVINVLGGVTRQLTFQDSVDVPWSWSPDGRWVYFSSDRDDRYRILRAPAEGGITEQISSHSGLCPIASNDGRYVYFTDEGFHGVYRVRADGGPRELLLQTEIYRSSFSRWRDRLVYLRQDECLGFVIDSLDPESGRTIRIAELGQARVGKYDVLSVSPDGRWILYPQDDGTGSDLKVVDGYVAK